MKKTIFATALLTFSLALFAGVSGCHSDPSDTHVFSGVSSPR